MLHSRILLLSFLNSQKMKTLVSEHVHSTCLPCHSTESTGGLQDVSCPLGAAVSLKNGTAQTKAGNSQSGMYFSYCDKSKHMQWKSIQADAITFPPHCFTGDGILYALDHLPIQAFSMHFFLPILLPDLSVILISPKNAFLKLLWFLKVFWQSLIRLFYSWKVAWLLENVGKLIFFFIMERILQSSTTVFQRFLLLLTKPSSTPCLANSNNFQI